MVEISSGDVFLSYKFPYLCWRGRAFLDHTLHSVKQNLVGLSWRSHVD